MGRTETTRIKLQRAGCILALAIIAVACLPSVALRKTEEIPAVRRRKVDRPRVRPTAIPTFLEYGFRICANTGHQQWRL